MSPCLCVFVVHTTVSFGESLCTTSSTFDISKLWLQGSNWKAELKPWPLTPPLYFYHGRWLPCHLELSFIPLWQLICPLTQPQLSDWLSTGLVVDLWTERSFRNITAIVLQLLDQLLSLWCLTFCLSCFDESDLTGKKRRLFDTWKKKNTFWLTSVRISSCVFQMSDIWTSQQIHQ